MKTKKLFKYIISSLLTLALAVSFVYAWNGLTASDGDTLSHTKWNELVTKVEETKYTYFAVWAEESADLGNGAHEWAYGNGNDTPSGMGIVIPFDCELFALGLTLEGNATTKVEVRKNGSAVSKNVTTSSNKKGFVNFENSPVSFSSGDVVGFRTINGHASSNGGVVVAWFRKEL